jgi:hypothetical protein
MKKYILVILLTVFLTSCFEGNNSCVTEKIIYKKRICIEYKYTYYSGIFAPVRRDECVNYAMKDVYTLIFNPVVAKYNFEINDKYQVSKEIYDFIDIGECFTNRIDMYQKYKDNYNSLQERKK